MSGFRPTMSIRIGNRVVTPLIRVGLPMGPMALLTVAGRKSGLPRTTPIAVLIDDTGWRVAAPYGVVDWFKNLRAAGRAVVSRRGRTTTVEAEELSAELAAPVLRESFRQAGRITRRVIGPYFNVTPEAPPTDWIVEAGQHPVFLLRPIDEVDSSRLVQ
ncbi:MAG TPA: nitroreductase family deazaflavin-dependent oxidoreductase [Acidimicrobiia bacterium]|nr:nitroreductase family deazaflavin-dependent oxidoreductase [Acidimicrobiia bacterium]